MGLMQAPAEAGRLIITPHPMLLDGQRNLAADLRAGESLYAFLARHVDGLDRQAWVVTIGGRVVSRHLWWHVFPKHGQVVEVRGAVGKSAVNLIAQVALVWFAFQAPLLTGWLAKAGISSGLALGAARAGVYMAGSLLINKVLQPKLASASASPAATAFSISAPRNRPRPYEPLGLLFGSMRIAPDVASNPYMNYEGDEQYVSLLLTPGINVARVEALYNGDALLSSFEGVQVWHSGFAGMPSEAIPLYSNAGSVDGGVILDTSSDPKHTPSKWVQRTSSAGAIRLQVNIEFRIFDADSKGRDYENREQIQIQYRAVGESAWRAFGTYSVAGRTQKSRRATYGLDVAPGQYEVQVRTTGQNTDGNNAQASFTWTSLTSILPDTASYDGIPRIGIRMKASGQLNGSPDEVRCVAHAQPIPVWKGEGVGWITEESSNPGAQILAYARGIKSPAGVRIAGMGLPDSQIDVEALKAFMLHCAANGFTYDYLVAEKRNHQTVMDAIALAGFGQIAWPKGRLAVTWAADEQPLSGVVNMATIKKGQFQVEYTLANSADGIEYSYLDRATWEAKTLRVPAPGVTTMLNPAQVTGEGVTSEAHAAMLARWHLAQSIYQYKSINYSTDIEHLAYGRMSVLALQHDLTQWGFGGQVLSATMGPGRTVTLQLDVPVPGRAQTSAFIGLRIPGERVYRVLKVVPFTGESDQLELADPWPADAALPGDSDGNPAWDTIWIYDFKQTPGYRVRVVGIQPESDLKGAAVDVVAEGPEFWHYVKTGTYIPPAEGSQLATRPVASNLRITERQVVQGDTLFTELQATFDISGPVGEIRVLSDVDRNGELEQVASTSTRSASWRIPGAGVYPVTVRPYNPDGLAGVAVTATYTTRNAGEPPVLVDLFDVEERSGGVRLYTWGWLETTTQSPDFAGVEIRYTEGSVVAPDWNAMTPVGQAGFHTAPFEAVVPASGKWTFACRSRNTSGDLSVAMQVIRKELQANLGEVISGVEEGQAELGRDLQKEISDRMDADLAEAAARAEGLSKAAQDLAAEASARAEAVAGAMDAVSAEARARVDAILNEKLEREADITREQQIRQSADESLARAVSEVAAGSGTQFDSIKLWPFNQTVEGWTGNGVPTLVDGWLRPADHAAAPWVQSPGALGIDGSAYRFVKLRVNRVGAPPWGGILQWITDTDQAWDTQKLAAIPEPAWDVNGVATVDVQDVAWWPATVDAIRLQLGTEQAAADYFLIDYVAVGRPQPGASVAVVQAETEARITADAAEAAQRNTLAVQMRGNYTGSDPLQLTSGLAYEELKARVAADSAQVQRISTMEARMPVGTGSLATAASVTALQEATATTTSALAQSITSINAALPAMIAQGSNMVLNGSWQSDKDVGWTYDPGATGTSWPATEGRAGGQCVRFDQGTIRQKAAYANGRTTLPTSPGKKYRYSCWYRSTPEFNGNASNSKLRLANQNGELIGGATPFGAGKAAWTYLSAVYAIPENTSITGLQLSILADNTAGTLWVDDVALEEVTELLANAQAISDLSTKVTQQGETITSQAGLLTSLRSDLTNVSGKTDANATALQNLTTRLTTAEGRIDSTSTSVTKLQTDVSSLQAATEVNSTALQVLNTRVTQAEGKITAQADQITDLSAGVTASFNRGENLNANAMFDGGMAPFVKGNASAVNGDVTWVSGAGQQGSAIEMVNKAGSTATPYVYANDARWVPLKMGRTGRRLRTVIVAKVVAGSATLTARCRLRNSTGEGNDDQTTPNLTTAWQRFMLEHPVGDDRTEAMSQVWITNRGSVDATVLVDRIEFYDVTDELLISANAAATAGLATTVTQQGAKLDATARDLTSLKTQVGDVSAAAFNQMQAQVQQDGQRIQANADAVSGLQIKVDGYPDAAVMQSMEASIANTGSTNLLANAQMVNRDGWNLVYSPNNGVVNNVYNATWANDGGLPTGAGGIIMLQSNHDGSVYLYGQDVPIEGDREYMFSAYASGSAWQVKLVLQFMDAAGNGVGAIAETPWVQPKAGGSRLDGHSRLFVKARAPAGAVQCRPHLLVNILPGQGNGFTRWCMPLLEAATPGQKVPGPWNVGGMESRASWGVSVRTDGKVAGIRLASNNGVSAFDVLADMFRLSSPSNGMRIEYSDGHFRIYDQNGRRRMRWGIAP